VSRLLLCCLILLAGLTAAVAQVPAVDPFPGEYWQWISPSPVGDSIADFSVVDDQVIFGSTLGGRIIKTSDGGATWVALGSGAVGWMTGIDFIDADTGTVVGQNNLEGVILRTTDGGWTWEHQEWEQLAWMEDVDFIDAQTGVAVGWSGTILWTTDGGQNWIPVDAGISDRLRSVHLFDSQTAVIAGGEGLICRTDDGGQTWVFPETHTTQRLESVAFGDAHNGIAVGRYGVVLATQNGGLFWSVRDSGTEVWLRQAAFLGSDLAAICGSDGVVSLSTSGGLYWEAVTPPAQETLGSVSFTTSGGLLVAGGAGALWESDPSFSSWLAHQQGTRNTLFAAASPGGAAAVAVGLKGTIVRSEDTGFSWTEIPTGTDTTFYGIDFAPDQHGSPGLHGMAVGEGGYALRTEDGGWSWEPMVTGNTVGFLDVECLSENKAVAVGWQCAISLTEDGGQTWTEVMGGHQYDYHRAVFFLDELRGWISTFYGDIYHTADGGHSWTLQHSSYLDLADITFGDELHGIAVGDVDGNATLVTADGGATWVEQPNPENAYLSAVYQSMAGKTMTVGGALFRSSDWGASWERDFSYGSWFNDILILEDGTGIAVGSGGAIIRAEPSSVGSTPEEVPGVRAVLKAYPNPFNPVTTLAYRISRAGRVTVQIHDLRGHLVASLVDEFQPAGGHECAWRALADDGRELASGIYLARLLLDGRPVGGATRLNLVK
jgi:photosystem II stability/assembly factor-like uncharacterized protein